MKRATLYPAAYTALCGKCGEPLHDPKTGSEMITPEDIALHPVMGCEECRAENAVIIKHFDLEVDSNA